MSIYEDCLKKWGKETQVVMCIEELAELIQVLAKQRRKINGTSIEKIAEEIADVELMIEQMKFAFDIHGDVEKWKDVKIKRLEGYLNGENEAYKTYPFCQKCYEKLSDMIEENKHAMP